MPNSLVVLEKDLAFHVCDILRLLADIWEDHFDYKYPLLEYVFLSFHDHSSLQNSSIVISMILHIYVSTINAAQCNYSCGFLHIYKIN